MLARAARAAEVAEAFVPQIRTLIDAERPIDDERRRRHAIVERGRIDEGFDRRARLAFGLRRAVERREADVAAALHRIDTTTMRTFEDHAARELVKVAQLMYPAPAPFAHDQVPGVH